MRIELNKYPYDTKIYSDDGKDISNELKAYGLTISSIDTRSPGGHGPLMVELQCYLSTANIEVLSENVKVSLLMTDADIQERIFWSLTHLNAYMPLVKHSNIMRAVNTLRQIIGYDQIKLGEPLMKDMDDVAGD